MPVDFIAGLFAVDAVAERPRRAVADRADDLVHPPAAGSDKRLPALAEHGGQRVGAESGVLADAAVVVDGHLLAGVGVKTVLDPAWILVTGKPDRCMRAVARRL